MRIIAAAVAASLVPVLTTAGPVKNGSADFHLTCYGTPEVMEYVEEEGLSPVFTGVTDDEDKMLRVFANADGRFVSFVVFSASSDSMCTVYGGTASVTALPRETTGGEEG